MAPYGIPGKWWGQTSTAVGNDYSLVFHRIVFPSNDPTSAPCISLAFGPSVAPTMPTTSPPTAAPSANPTPVRSVLLCSCFQIPPALCSKAPTSPPSAAPSPSPSPSPMEPPTRPTEPPPEGTQGILGLRGAFPALRSDSRQFPVIPGESWRFSRFAAKRRDVARFAGKVWKPRLHRCLFGFSEPVTVPSPSVTGTRTYAPPLPSTRSLVFTRLPTVPCCVVLQRLPGFAPVKRRGAVHRFR